MAKLHVKKVRRIRGVTVDSLPMVIGRSSESALVLPHNAVSRHHCIIESADGQARIRDLGSRYGTRVNGEKVAIAPLYDGDRIGVGPFEITFVDPSAPASLSDDDGDVSSASSMFEGSDVEDTSTVESDELHLLREQVRTDQETLEQSQQELGKQWAELGEARHELQQHREQIEQQREEMQAQIAVWEESKQGLEAKQDRIAVELEKLTGELVRAHAETETERQRAESLETKLTSERQRYQEELQRLNQQVQESAAAHRAADANVDSQREELSRLQRDLEAKTERLTRATSLAATLKEKVHALEVAHKDFSRRMGTAEAALAHLAPNLQQLHQVSERLSAVQTSLRTLEEVWSENSEWIEEAQQHDPRAASQGLEQQEAIAQQLELAHAERDAMVTELQNLLHQFTQIAVHDLAEHQAATQKRPTLLGKLARK